MKNEESQGCMAAKNKTDLPVALEARDNLRLLRRFSASAGCCRHL